MQLTNHRTLPVLEQLLAIRPLLATLSQSQQSDEDISLRVLVAQERLPSTVGDVISSHKFEFVGLRNE
jgi:hypothetical protein